MQEVQSKSSLAITAQQPAQVRCVIGAVPNRENPLFSFWVPRSIYTAKSPHNFSQVSMRSKKWCESFLQKELCRSGTLTRTFGIVEPQCPKLRAPNTSLAVISLGIEQATTQSELILADPFLKISAQGQCLELPRASFSKNPYMSPMCPCVPWRAPILQNLHGYKKLTGGFC